ncbi:MAG: type II toxin-antitoxin system VapC family toxin [Spirochaetaceae bacterium]|nr:MAG: type II toxin-antitoxin system VapC family toxin [Spirochaetaceae bacterium]
MEMTFLLDTNVISEVMKRQPDTAVLAWFHSLQEVVTSAICLEELVFGLRRRSAFKKEAWLRRMLADVGSVLPVTDTAAQWSGEKRELLQARGLTVHQADALIAACAWEHGLILATRNSGDFSGFGIPVLNPFEYGG